MSYVVSSCIEWLQLNWNRIPYSQRLVILRDTVEALQDNQAGMDTIDVPTWKSFLKWGMDGLDDTGKQWVHDTVAHRQKPWPGYNDDECVNVDQ